MSVRRDDITSLKEQRAHVLKDMQDKFAVAEGESREFTAEEQQEYDNMEGEFRSLTQRWQRAEELYEQEKAVKKALDSPIDLKIESDDDVPMKLSEYRSQRGGMPIQDTPEFRSAWFHSMSVAKMNDLDIEEHRVLSKASAGAGLNLVPTSFRNEIINILRFTGPFNQLAEEIVTDSGETLQVPSVSAHGVATWTAENAGYTASDETFGQISLGAFKAGRAVIVSEELLTDTAFDLEAYLAQELGTSIGVLEETAFAIGDGSGKPLGIATAGNGITVSQAASATRRASPTRRSSTSSSLWATSTAETRSGSWPTRR
jgi:HK97 family phage major capsid protein